jgi:hypothetical protein
MGLFIKFRTFLMQFTMATSVESQVQQRLQIQWVYTQELVQEARRRRQDTPSDDEEYEIKDRDIVDDACDLFAGLSAEEQARRKIGANDHEEPEWKRKIREKAERQEAEWRTRQNLEQLQSQVQEKLREQGLPEPEVQATTIKSIRKLEGNNLPAETAVSPTKAKVKPIEHVRTYACYCVIQ